MPSYYYHHRPGSGPSLPERIPGHHRWIALAMFAISEEAAARGHSSGQTEPVLLDRENLVEVTVGCYDCECSYPEGRDTPCPGDPEEDING